MKENTTTVLVVEDNETLRTVVAQALERTGRRVLVSRDAEDALQVFEGRRDRIHLVITDMKLPGIDGHSLANELRRRDPFIAILIISGGFYDPPGEFPELDKPFTITALEERVAEVMKAASGGPPARIRIEP